MAVSNTYMIDKVYRNNIIIIVGKLYELSICRSEFGHNNSHSSTLSQHKISPDVCKHILCTQIWKHVLHTSSIWITIWQL